MLQELLQEKEEQPEEEECQRDPVRDRRDATRVPPRSQRNTAMEGGPTKMLRVIVS